jgi:hypothetical protein
MNKIQNRYYNGWRKNYFYYCIMGDISPQAYQTNGLKEIGTLAIMEHFFL